MRARPVRLFLVSAGCLALSCTAGSGGECQLLWKASPAGGTITIADGGLNLNAAWTSAWPGGVSVSQPGLTGDFSLRVQIDSFSANDSSGEVAASLAVPDGGVRLIGSATGDRIEVVYQPAQGDRASLTQPEPTAPASGVVLFSRAGGTGTVTVIAGGETLTTNGEVGSGPLALSVSAIRPDPDVDGGETTVRIGTVAVMDDGGTFSGDTFQCDTLGP
jgi:hypothetical protein